MTSPAVFLYEEGGNKELKVETNKAYTIALRGNPSTGYSWYMANVDTVKNSKAVEMLNLDKYNGSIDFVKDHLEPGQLGWGIGGVYNFKFKVKDAAANKLPKLIFEYKKIWEDNDPPYGIAEITLI